MKRCSTRHVKYTTTYCGAQIAAKHVNKITEELNVVGQPHWFILTPPTKPSLKALTQFLQRKNTSFRMHI
jgi:hypothetical protein